jgi:lambda family phage tail tape measure protein
MATVEDFVLRMKVEGQGSVKQISGSIQTLKDDLADLGQVGGPLGNTINGIIGKLGPLGMAASVAGAAFVGLGAKALSLAGELSDISGATGIAAGTLMNFRQSVVEAGGKAEDFAQIAAKLNQSVQEAASGNETFQKAFQRLGVFVTDGNGKLRSTESILQDVVAKFQSGQLSSEQYAASIDILGKNINKLELQKLSAAADPFKDEQIRQLDKYNDAIDKLGEKFNNLAITVAGTVATSINGFFDKLNSNIKNVTDSIATLEERGLTQQGIPAPVRGAGLLFGYVPARKMTDEEKAAFKASKDAEEQRKRLEQEQARLMSGYKTRAGTRADSGQGTPGGGFGATPEATIKAREESLKKIKVLEVEQSRQTQLAANSERLSAILQFASQEEAIKEKTAAAVKDIEINIQAEIAKARLEIYGQERLSEQEKAKEFAAKRKEIELKGAADVAKARGQMSEQLSREYERIQSIITQSKARVEEEQRLNDLLDQRNKFINENSAATDAERRRAEELFNLEQERLKVLRQIALIKDLPEGERLAREREINAIYDQRREKTIQQQQADKNLTENFSAGFEKAYRQYAEDSRNAFERGARIFKTFTQGMEDAIVNFTKTGKLNFNDLVNTLIEEILRAEIRLLASNIMGAIGGGSKGGGKSFLGSLLGFANGGIIPTNGPVVVGERGPELLVGASGNRVIPNGQFGGGSVTYNIQAVDAASFKALVARDPGFIHAVAQQGAKSVPRR